MDKNGTEVLPREAVALVNTCEAVIVDVDETVEDVPRGCIMEETVAEGLVTGPMNRQMCMRIKLQKQQQFGFHQRKN